MAVFPSRNCVQLALMILVLTVSTAMLGAARRHGRHNRHQQDEHSKKYHQPKETKGVLRKHAEVHVKLTNRLDPQFSLACPEECMCHLLKVYCDGQQLYQLPKRLPKEAEVLMAKDNNIKRIWQLHLAGITHMKHLNLKNNKIQYIEPSAFIDMPHLNSLNLMNNRIRYLSADTFRNKKTLQFLSLSNNKLRNIDGLFRKLPRLHLLNIGGNRVPKITEMAFKHNPKLRVLDLHNNKISYINKYAFKGLPLLKFLILRDNPLTIVDMDFKMNFHLELLDFTNCKLTQMVHGLPHSIRDLRLAENAITKLGDDDFKTTRRIRLLVLDQNRIESISNGTFKRLWQLYDLYLSKNRISQIPERLPVTLHGFYANNNHIKHIKNTVFQNILKLEFLFLKSNAIHTIDAEGFKGLEKLKSLDLSNNGLEDLQPLAFSSMTGLQVLDLSGNPLDTMEHNCFDGLKNLHILQMSSVATNAGTPPVIFKDMHKLLFLDLQNSSKLVRHLSENPYVLRYLRSVEDLNLIDDGLFSLPKSFPKHFPYLKTVKMVGNPWHCDISIYWLTLWMRRSKVNFYKAEDMRCASPPKLKGRKIRELREDELPRILPPNNKVKPNVTVIDFRFKHALNNVTLIFNISVADDSASGKGMMASVHFNKKHQKSGTSSPQSKPVNKRHKAKKMKKRPDNDVILGDSGVVYQSSGSIHTSLLLDSERNTDSKVNSKVMESSKTKTKGNKRGKVGNIDGSGNIMVSSALSLRAFRESSGETEPFLT